MGDLIEAPVRIELDLSLSKRKRVHAVMNAKGETRIHLIRTAEVIAWLLDQDVHEAIFVDGEDRFSVQFRRLIEVPAS